MSEILEQIKEMQRQIESLRREVAGLRRTPKTGGGLTLEEISYFENLPLDSVVGKDYVAWRFGCSVRAVRRGERGTGAIARVSNSPLQFIKRAVDQAWNDRRKKPIPERAQQERAKAKKRIYSVIQKNV